MPQSVGGDNAWEQALNDKLGKITGRSSEYLRLSLDSLFQSTRPETVVNDSEDEEEKRSVV